jgi:hypothetical protein
MPTEDAVIFNLVQMWMYSWILATSTSWDDLVLVWIFGDAHVIPLLQNEAANCIRDKVIEEWLVPSHQLDLIYPATTEVSPLRRLAISLIGKTSNAKTVLSGDVEKYWSKEALLDSARLVWGSSELLLQKQEDVRKWDTCKYHVHEEGVECPKPGK